ncbi:MAG: hypothetical protein J6W52_13215 [Bacteroidaceae bacterium]|nr:hypothetical protein [Bacteroidaceae bacterium]
MKHNIITFTLSTIAIFFCLPTMAIRNLSTDQEITNLLQNPDFGHEFQGWTLTQQGGSITVQEKTDGTFEVQSQGCEFTLEQTVTGLPDGIYELEIDGYYAAEAMPQSMLHGSMIYMNDMKNVFISSHEYMLLPEYPTNKVIARSQDGELNIKIVGRNLASSTDLTLFSNLHLFYRGQDVIEAHSACSSLHTDMQFILETAFKCHSTNIEDYIQHPSCNYSLMRNVGLEAYDTTVNWNKIIETLKYYGELLEDVCNSRAAYIKLMRNTLQTENTANLLIANNILTEKQYNAAIQVLNTAIEGYTKGSFSNKDVENKLKEIASLDGLPKFIDNVMQISTPNDLCSFSLLVNEGLRTLDAQLTANIDMTKINNFQPIGLYSDSDAEHADFYSCSYGGTFNGQGFEVRNLILQTSFEGGLFGRCYRAQINNLGIVNVSVTGTGAQTCGTLAGTLMQTRVDNCYVAGTIQVSTTGKMSAQFAGEGAWNTCFNNCYTFGDDFTNVTAAELNNCYWGSIATNAARSGELCYNLNNGETIDPIYFQTLGKDAYPVLLSDHEIVRRSSEGNYYNGEDEDAVISVDNSQCTKVNDQSVYDLSGRRLSQKPRKGLYIQGGKIRQ